MIKKCEVCGNKVSVVLSQIKKGFGRFCSRKCMGINQSKLAIGANNPNWKGGGANCVCLICCKKFYVFPAKKKIGAGKFCSKECHGAWKSKNNIGENNPHWKNGITPAQLRIRNSYQYAEWRLSIFKRDSYTCQDCGQVGGRIRAHHLKRFSVILNDIQQKFPLFLESDIAYNYKDLWDTKNGVTLCEKCHKEIHKKEGNK